MKVTQLVDRAIRSETRIDALLHPNLIARVGGESVAVAPISATAETASLLLRLQELHRDLQDRRTDLCAHLESAYPSLAEQGLGRELIQLKRDIFNCRPARPDERLLAELAPLSGCVRGFLDDAAMHHDMISSVSACYKEEVAKERVDLRGAWQKDNLRSAILCSNHFLFTQLDAIFQSDRPLASDKKTAHACDSLLSYANRTALKASPLSSFTLIWVGKWEDGGVAPDNLALDTLPYVRKIELKQAAILHAIEPTWSELEILGDEFPLKLNPTLEIEESQLSWVQLYRSSYHHPKVWGHNGSRLTIASSRQVQVIVHVFQSAAGRPISAEVLLEFLAKIEKDPGKRRKFVAQLVDLQLLTPDLQKFEQEPLIPWLLQTLEAMPTERAGAIRSAVSSLSAVVEQFSSPDVAVRQFALRQVDEVMADLVCSSGASIDHKALAPVLYEDCFVTGQPLTLDPNSVSSIISDCASLLELIPALDFNHVMQSLFARRFRERFGAGGVCNEPVAFLRELTDSYFGGESESDPSHMAALHAEQMEVESGRSIHEARKNYLNLLKDADNIDDTIVLDPARLTAIVSDLSDTVRARPLSQSFTGQFATGDDGRQMFVVNQVLPGLSGMMSRFLSACDEAGLADVRQYIADASPTGHYAELSAVFGFNANLHPALTTKEITLPGFHPGYQATEKLPVQEMTITLSAATDRLIFRHRGQAIDPVYLGFMTPALLPRQLRPLITTSTQNKILFVTREIERQCGRRDGDVTVTPRVMFGDVCLARRSYVFGRRAVPNHADDDCTFFASIWRWRTRHGLPKLAFWRLLPESTGDSAQQVQSSQRDYATALAFQTKFDPTAFKPAFINFDSPSSVRLLRRALARNDLDLAIEEALPSPDMHSLMVDGEKRLCEYQFEVTRRGTSEQ